MPTLRMTVPKQDLTDEQRRRLVDRLTETVGAFYEEEGKGDIRANVVIHISETAGQGYGVGVEIIG